MDTDKTKTDPQPDSHMDSQMDSPTDSRAETGGQSATPASDAAAGTTTDAPREINGPKGPEPTRYGDWEQKGRCSDF